MPEISVHGYECCRCGHTWVPTSFTSRGEGRRIRPLICPKCKSPYWDTPRRKPK